MSLKIFFRNIGHIIAFPIVATSLMIGLSKSKSLYKRYISEPETIIQDERYEYIYKQVGKATFIANCKINVYGIEKIPNLPVMFICNHKSGFDPLLLLKIFSKEQKIVRPVFVSKKELLNDKKIGNAAKLIDTIFIDRKNIRSAIQCLEEEKKILNKRSVVVFIEGTRILTKEFGEFKSAALEPAYKTMRHIVPVVIHGSVGVEKENKKNFFKYKEINIKFLNPLKYNDFIHYSRDAVAEKLKNLMYDEYLKFEEKNPLNYSHKDIYKKNEEHYEDNYENNNLLTEQNNEETIELNNPILNNEQENKLDDKEIQKESIKVIEPKVNEVKKLNNENNIKKETKPKIVKQQKPNVKRNKKIETKDKNIKPKKQSNKKGNDKKEKIIIPKALNKNKKVPSKFDF